MATLLLFVLLFFSALAFFLFGLVSPYFSIGVPLVLLCHPFIVRGIPMVSMMFTFRSMSVIYCLLCSLCGCGILGVCVCVCDCACVCVCVCVYESRQ